MNIFSVVLFLINWWWESGMSRWENSLVVSAHTSVHVVGQLLGMAAISVCVPRVSHSHALPLWETLQDKQSLLKFGLSLGFTPLFHLVLILGLEHWAGGCRDRRTKCGREEPPHVWGQRWRPGGATWRPRPGAVAGRSNPMSKELWLRQSRRA